MAPPRKKKRAPGEGHPVHLRLPGDVFQWVERRASAKGWPLNRAIISLLADVPYLEKLRTQEEILDEMQLVLARYGSRITLADFNEPLLKAVDEILAAQTDGELRSRLDRLKVVRAAMVKQEQEQASKE
jgi:hypothetical protein